MNADDVLADGSVTVRAGTYAVIKSRRPNPGAFATIDDGNEVTVIVESDEYEPDDAIAVRDGWKLLTFDMVLPFELVGFLARVSTVFADAGVSIFAISAYSTDHVLVSEDDIEAAIEQLEGLGCTVTVEQAP